MKNILERFIAAILSLCMMLTLLPPIVLAQQSILYGDVNRSSYVDQDDVEALKKYLAEYSIDIDTDAADVNMDGSIDLLDLLLVEKYVNGLDVDLGDIVTITFDTDGGTPVQRIMLCNGTVLTDVTREPVTQKEGFIFVGWVKEDGSPFYANEPITTNLRLRAVFEAIDSNIEESPLSFAMEDQSPDITFDIVTVDNFTANEILNNISLLTKDGSEPVELKVVMVSGKLFIVSAVDGFIPGCTYELVLDDGLFFKDKAESIRKATFTIHKEDVDNLKYNEEIRYIRDTDEMSYTIDGLGITVPMLEIAIISNDDEDVISGSFEYPYGGIAVGDTLCIYENVDPRERDYAANDYSDDSVAFIKVTEVNGSTIYFKGIDDDQVSDVIFIPDTIPFSVDKLPVLDNSTIDSGAFDLVAWSFMGRSEDPVFNVGDFVVLYVGHFEDMTEDSHVYFGEITAIDGTTIHFKRTTADTIKAANEVFLSKPISGDDLLENIDVDSVEEQVGKQAIDSGFVQEAVDYILDVAEKTDKFRNMTLENVAIIDEEGKPLTKSQIEILKKDKKPEIKVTPKISKNCDYFSDGVRLELHIEAEFSVDLEEGEMKFVLEATFIEEISVKVNMYSHADVTWYLFVPVLDELTFGANTDIKNYTSVAIDLRIYTVEEPTLWDKFENFRSKYKDTLKKIKELQQKIDESIDSPEKLEEYKQQIKSLWSKLPAGSEQEYDEYCDELGEQNMSSELNKLLRSTSEEQTEAAVQNLMDKYSKMMKKETSWVTLVEQEIFEVKVPFAAGLVSVNFSVDFVIKANVNISIGARMDYLVGKRYSFWIDVMDKKSGSSVTDLTDEKFAFTFYVMGHIGLEMGVKATVSLEVLWGLAEAGISGEFGPYLKLWGYFIYTYTKMRPANTNNWNIDSKMAGALYLEFGIYVTISFDISLVKKTVYNPDLYDKEFPLLTAGVRNNVYAFGYKLDSDEVVLVKDHDNNSNTGISMMLPESYRLMQYIDLVEGNIEKSVYDLSSFSYSLSNSNFSFDPKTGMISVSVPDQVHYMKCNLVLTWKQGKLSFTNKDLRMVIPLVWTDLSDTELKEKFTVTVNVGNPSDGYVPVWSDRVLKGQIYKLPSHDEILELINYTSYDYNGTNLKYDSITGYNIDPDAELNTYMDQDYYFDVNLKEYTLRVNDMQNVDGTTDTLVLKAKFGEKFDLSSLKKSGSDDDKSGKYTAYYSTVARDQYGETINSDIGRVIDIGFAKELLGGTDYSATYVENTVTATFKFEGDVNDIPVKTVKIKRGTTPPDVFTQDIAARRAIVKSITPKLGPILSDTTYTVVSKLKPIVMRTITFVTNGGSSIVPVQIPEESQIVLPADPTKEGYTFAGWYTDPSFENAFVMKDMPSHDITLYAKWEGLQFNVTFDGNGGTLPSGTVNPITVTNGAVYGDLPTPSRASYKFLGWYTQRTGGTRINVGDTVHLLKDTTLYAVWELKSVINSSSVTMVNQSKTYNRNRQYADFSAPAGIAKNSFVVTYKRQNDSRNEWVSYAENAGIYDVKISRLEDKNYQKFEKTFTGVFTINKAVGTINAAPVVNSVYYGNIVPKPMNHGTDYYGEKLEYAVSTSRTTPPVDGWTVGAAYNIYDSKKNNITGTSVYLWARVAESENYLTSTTPTVSASPVTITTKPKSLISSNIGGTNFIYMLLIKTSDRSDAGTDSKIYVKIGNGPYQHLDNPDINDFERGDTNSFTLSIDPNLLYNTSGGNIPITLKYEKSGTKPGWHCEYVQLYIVRYNTSFFPPLMIVLEGNRYNVNHWFGAEDYNRNVIEETYTLTNFERNISFNGSFTSEPEILTLQPKSSDFNWNWTNPVVTDSRRGDVSYNPYEFINAPVLSVSFDNNKYNRYIVQDVKSFTILSKDLYAAMAADGVSSLNLTYSLGFKPLNGVASVTSSSVRTRTIKIERGVGEAGFMSAGGSLLMATKSGNRVANVLSDVKPGNNGTFDVTYRLDENQGMWGAKFAVDYDETAVELTGYTLGDVFSEGEVIPPEEHDEGRYVFLATRSSDFTDTMATGKLVTLHFKIKDGTDFADYPVALDYRLAQGVNADGEAISPLFSMISPKINLSGNTNGILKSDTVIISTLAGKSSVQSVKVKKDKGDFTDITSTYSQGYTVTENGTYTFVLTTIDGATASTSITYTTLDNAKPEVIVNAGGYTENTWATGTITLTPYNTVSNLGMTTYSYRVGENGSWTVCTSGVTVTTDSAELDSIYYFKAVSEAGVESDIVPFKVKLDNKSPSSEISIEQNKWNTLLNKITFGLFFKNTKEVKIESVDTGSGVAKTEFYLSSEEISDVSSIESWTEYTKPVTIGPNHKYVVYARATDNTGNVSIVNSDGVVLFTDSTVNTTKVSFVKTSTDDVTASVNLNGNTIKGISIDGKALTENTDYAVSNGNITLKAGYLRNLPAGEYTVDVSYYPLGEKELPSVGSETPASTTFALKVDKAALYVSIIAEPSGKQTRPNSVILSAKLPEGATGTLQFKANGKNIGEPASVGQTVTFKARGSVNEYTFTVEYSGDDNYAAATSEGVLYWFMKGEQAALAFAADTPAEKTYGDEPFTVNATGGSGAGAVKYSIVSGPAEIDGNKVTLTGVGTVVIRATKDADDDYNEKSVDATINVKKKQVTITGVSAESKIYDGTDEAVISGTPVLDGKVNGDRVDIVEGRAVFADKNVGNGKMVTFSGFSLTGDDADKYILTAQPADVVANITLKSIIVTVTIMDKAYDGLNTATIANAELNDTVVNDDVTLAKPYPEAFFNSVNSGNNISISFSSTFTLTGEDAGNYTLIQPSSITGTILNTYTAEEGVDYIVNQTDWSNTDFVVTAKAGFELSLTNTAGGVWSDSLTRSDETANGTIVFYVRNKSTGAISLEATEIYRIDKTAPTGDIAIDTDSIKQLLNAITFGLFFKDTQTITIASADESSGVASVGYKLSSTVLDESDVLEISDWNEYTGEFTLEPGNKMVVYVKIADTAGNVTYIGSDGLVIDSTAPVINGLQDGNVYCDSVIVEITDENLDSVTIDGQKITLTDGKLTLSPTGAPQTIVATDKAGNSTTETITIYDGHEWDEGVVTVEPTASVEGEIIYNCIHCGETRAEKIDKLPPAIIDGDDVQWKPGSSNGLTFRSDGAFSDFIGVLVDDEEVDPENYDVKEGSIVVTLKPGYLAALSAGTHTVSIVSTTGTAIAEFTILAELTPTEPGDKEPPKTGSNSNMYLWAIMISVGMLALISVKSRRRKRVK